MSILSGMRTVFLSLIRITVKRKALSNSMKPRKEGLIKDIKPDETRTPSRSANLYVLELAIRYSIEAVINLD
jgi:hypothetical protein